MAFLPVHKARKRRAQEAETAFQFSEHLSARPKAPPFSCRRAPSGKGNLLLCGAHGHTRGESLCCDLHMPS